MLKIIQLEVKLNIKEIIKISRPTYKAKVMKKLKGTF